MVTLSIYGSHHAAVAIERDGEYFILEAEQFLNRAGSGLTHFDPAMTPDTTTREMYLKLKKELNISGPPDRYVYSELGVAAPFFAGILEAQRAHSRFIEHHRAHAANSFYQSPFDDALVITCDSGGDDGVFNIHLYSREKKPQTIARLKLNLGYTYSLFGTFIGSIRGNWQDKRTFLTYPKKLMSMAALGDVRQEWLGTIEKLFRAEPLTPDDTHSLPLDPYNTNDVQIVATTFGNLLALPVIEGLQGMFAYDFAATAQHALENVFMTAIAPHLEAYPSLPLCLGGGVANNIYLNRRIKKETNRELFVPLNADNSGIALGMILTHTAPSHGVNFSHVGPHLLDKERLNELTSLRDYIDVSARQVGELLGNGKLLGIARGRASHGPYSLGSRSIVCDAASPNIATIMRHAISGGPAYLPFDALVRAESLSEYVQDAGTYAYPNYPLQLKPKYKSVFPSITHFDGTVRLYSVDKRIDPWLHEVLRWFETYNGHGLLLTAPLCRDNEPPVSTVAGALHLLDHTLLEGVVLEDRLVWRLPNGGNGIKPVD